ncbi:MAG: hypothetical protein ABI830_15010, partial [Pseudolabrys sp.]
MTKSLNARWALAVLACAVILIAPALWNGFALLQYDTGGYLARWYEGYLVPSRAVVYGLILNAGVPLAFWPVVVAQAALTVWVLALVLRAHGLGKRPMVLLAVIAALSIISTLPFLTAILLTDIFCGLSVLALYLLLMRGDTLSRREQAGLIVLTAVSAATHSATLAVLLALMAAAILFWLIDRARMPTARIGHGLLALALGAAMVLAANAIVAKQLAWTPGGFALSFGRMLQDGIVTKYLDKHCPDPKLQLCAYKDQLPNDADVWFWGNSVFIKLGRFDGLGAEMEKIAVGSLIEFPGLQLQTAAVATARQLIEVHTGEGVLNSLWHTYGIIERYAPQLVPAMRAAHQQKGDISFEAINAVQYPVALISMALLPFIVLLARRKTLSPGIGEFAAAVILALLANAFVCGALSNPHDRYGARMV